MTDLLLLIETSGPQTHVGLAQWRAGDWASVAELPSPGSPEAAAQAPMQHTALVLPLVRAVLAGAPPLDPAAFATLTPDGHLDLRRDGFARLAAVAVSSGPGSYTALRAGLSSGKGICAALGVPLLKCDTLRGLCAVARSRLPEAAAGGGHTVALLPARRDEVYFGMYAPDGSVVGAPAVGRLSAEWAAGLAREGGVSGACGPDSALVERFCALVTEGGGRAIPGVRVALAASNLLDECRIRMAEKDYDDLASTTPDYLRAPHITQPRTRV